MDEQADAFQVRHLITWHVAAMLIVAVVSQKDRCGRFGLAINLAVAAEEASCTSLTTTVASANVGAIGA